MKKVLFRVIPLGIVALIFVVLAIQAVLGSQQKSEAAGKPKHQVTTHWVYMHENDQHNSNGITGSAGCTQPKNGRFLSVYEPSYESMGPMGVQVTLPEGLWEGPGFRDNQVDEDKLEYSGRSSWIVPIACQPRSIQKSFTFSISDP